MKKDELREILDLVKEKLAMDPETACGLFWPDHQPTTLYNVGEEDCNMDYACPEYAVAE